MIDEWLKHRCDVLARLCKKEVMTLWTAFVAGGR